ncbi:MAG: hypothetical protein P8I91_08335 [Phycisphaerales bacterium]|nr:hypothetical protein [Phycisphaerales bacterium]
MLYIVGNARSVSAIFASMAGQLNGVFAAGELARVRPEPSDAICGVPLMTCTVWSRILASRRWDVSDTLCSDVRWIAQRRSRRRHISRLLLSAIGSRAATWMQRVHQSLLGATTDIMGDAGFVVPPGEAAVLAPAIERAIKLPQAKRRSLGAHGRLRVSSRYCQRKTTTDYESLWRTLGKPSP